MNKIKTKKQLEEIEMGMHIMMKANALLNAEEKDLIKAHKETNDQSILDSLYNVKADLVKINEALGVFCRIHNEAEQIRHLLK